MKRRGFITMILAATRLAISLPLMSKGDKQKQEFIFYSDIEPLKIHERRLRQRQRVHCGAMLGSDIEYRRVSRDLIERKIQFNPAGLDAKIWRLHNLRVKWTKEMMDRYTTNRPY